MTLIRFQDTGGISAPSQVEAGSTGPVEVRASGSSRIVIRSTTTGERKEVPVDADGKARFELPAGATPGSVIHIIDPDNPSKSAGVLVVAASSP